MEVHFRITVASYVYITLIGFYSRKRRVLFQFREGVMGIGSIKDLVGMRQGRSFVV